MWVEVILFCVTVLVAWDYLRKRRHNNLLSEYGISGPKALPLLGNALDLLAEGPETLFDFNERLIEAHGKTIKLWFVHEITILTADAKLLEAIFSSQLEVLKSKSYEFLRSWLGNGLLLSTGQKWFKRRRIITPTFHFKILDEFVEVFDQQSAIMTKLLYDRADGKTPIDMFPVACLAALDIIAETAMGVKINAQMNSDFPYVKSVTTVSSMTAERFLNPAHRFDGLMRLIAPRKYRKLMENIKLMHNFADGVIKERRSALKKSMANGTYSAKSKDEGDMGTKKRMALLDVLLQSSIDGNSLSNADIREEVDTFMFGGHDTTTSGISFTLYLIARHPEVQTQLFKEIRDVIGDDKDKPISMRELNDLKYLDSVIKESMRFYPPVPLIGRFISKDVMLDGKLIPANTNFILLIYKALRDPDYFPNPDKFDPERFRTNSKQKIGSFAYTPFSAGPRNCIGQKYAMFEMKTLVSKMLRHFELLPLGPDVKPLMNIMLRSSTGIHIGLRPRVY